MLLTRRFPIRLLLLFSAPTVLRAAAWATVVFALYAWAELTFLRVPFLPIGTVGTAVAFYVGFKNNAAYDRFWEGRKIWGGIVNVSRTWATAVTCYVHAGHDDDDARAARRALVLRHLAWVNALRLQLRRTSRFHERPSRTTRARLERHAELMRNDWELELSPLLADEELAATRAVANPAAHLLQRQGEQLATMVRAQRLDLFHQISMMEAIREMYSLQGMCERIKNTPLPRQYAEFSRLFTRVLAVLLPFGMLDVFATHIEAATRAGLVLPGLTMVLSSSLVTWVFIMMEGIGDSSEDPFERSMNDVPMNALSRGIEIDLRQMLGDTAVPAPERAVDHILY
ncbi:MAG: hypothetical protein IPH07_25390 [Deltaproteobacteria bacterium]|nr:hypothetical protein [Deltaproteobacteria bacterium]MBK8240634.1 hypothetical protein [Deltaproteobacteria bacterium]MBK8718091.1 hypothetical protein [Deltaproteobacteria bacterium]MBP7288499.1 hypothetical protein [Nannocystaceae bacterium]